MDPSKNTGVPAPIQLFPSSPSIQSAQAPMQASYMPAATSPVYFNPSTTPFYPGQPQQVPQQSMVYFPSDQPTNYPAQAQQQAVYVATPPAGSHALPSAAMSDVALDKGDYDPAADDEMGMTQTEQAFGLHFNFDEKKQLDITSWFNRGWGLYKENWGYYTLFALAFYILTMLSWLGEAEDREESGVFLSLTYGIGWITWPMQLGYFVAGAHIVRHRVGPGPHATVPFSVSNLFRPFFVYFPLLLLTILYGLAVSLGLICLIIPGIYLAVTLSLAPYLYLENHHSVNFFDPQATSSFGVLNALSVSRRIIHTYFWKWFIFLIMVFLLNFFAGFLIVLPLVTVPVSNLALVFAYHDMVGLMPHRGLDTHCFCCC